MRSSKSRSRSKNNRSRSVGNIVNRVFDSSGPEGKVRGTPQQIIDKYNQLARDAQLSNDRVATENFQQHSEHYTRMLSEAQREADARREQHNQDQPRRDRDDNRDRDDQRDREVHRDGADSQPETAYAGSDDQQAATPEPSAVKDTAPADPPQEVSQSQSSDTDIVDTPHDDSGLVDTPESAAEQAPAKAEKAEKPKKPRRPRTSKPKAAKTDSESDNGDESDANQSAAAD